MRKTLLVTLVAAAALAVPATAGLPRAGTLVPGQLARRDPARRDDARRPRRARPSASASATTARGRRGTSRTSRSTRTGSRSSSSTGVSSAVYTLWQPTGLARDERPPPRRDAAPGARPRRPAPHDHVQRLRRARRRPARARAPRTSSTTARSGDSGCSCPTGALADDRARGRRGRRRRDSPASRTARRSSPRARSTSASAPRVHIKAECFQRGGAFKFRGAYNKISSLDADALARGVVAYSSGNHAQAVALAAKLLGSRATIVMPEDAPAAKLEATRGYGAEVVTYDRCDGEPRGDRRRPRRRARTRRSCRRTTTRS